MDNERNFSNKVTDKLCEQFDFKQYNFSMCNAATNELAKAFNKKLYNLFKNVVANAKRYWREQVGEALWTNRTTHRTSTQMTS